MGLLDQFKAYIQANTPRATTPRVSPGKVINEGLLNPNQFNATAANRFKDSLFGMTGIVPGVGDVASGVQAADFWNRGEKLNAGLSALGALPFIPTLHTVYHGSPHKFNKFDMSKIGTGEGAQAYGHGLYFAESPGVAKSYQDNLARIPSYEVRGASAKLPAEFKSKVASGKLSKKDLDSFAATVAQNYREIPAGDGDRAASTLIGAARNWYGAKFPLEVEDMLDDYARTLTPADIDRIKGAFYKVDIPDEAIPRMLDWDRSLDQQSPEVIAALEKVGIIQPWELVSDTGHALGRTFKTQAEALADAPAGWTARVRPATNKGNAVYENLAAQVGKAGRYDNPLPKDYAATSELLKQAGIPGIRYLDGTSRVAGNGTSNYVLFDDSLARILEINGQPTGLLAWNAK